MVIDSSSIVAILQDEPERDSFNRAIEAADRRAMSVASFVETSMGIASRFGPEGIRNLDLFVAKARIELIAVDSEQGHVARTAFSIAARKGSANCLSFAAPTPWTSANSTSVRGRRRTMSTSVRSGNTT